MVDFCLEKHYLHWAFKRRKSWVIIEITWRGRDNHILNILCVPVIMLGVVKCNRFPDSWNNRDTSAIIGSSYGFVNLCVGKGYEETKV